MFSDIRMKINITIIAVLLLCFSVAVLGQNKPHAELSRKQGRAFLDNAKGFGNFTFGSPPKLYKTFKFKPDEFNSKRYFSKVAIIQEGIKIDSVYLHFSDDKLCGLTMYTNKSNTQKLMAYCVRNFGPVSHDGDPDNFFWYGRKKNLSFREVNSVLEINFADLSIKSEADMADTSTIGME